MLPHAGPGALAGFLAAMAMTGLPFAALTPTHAISLAALFAGPRPLRPCVEEARSTGHAASRVRPWLCLQLPRFLLQSRGLRHAARRHRRRRGDPRGALRPAALDAAIIGLSCLAGYLGFWTMKSLLALPYAYLASGVDPVRAGDFLRWAGGGEGDYRPFAASLHLVATTLNHPAKLALFSAALIGILAQELAAGAGSRRGSPPWRRRCWSGSRRWRGPRRIPSPTPPYLRIVPLALALGLLATGAALSPAAGRTRRRQGRRDDCAAPAASGRAPPARLRAATSSAGRPAR